MSKAAEETSETFPDELYKVHALDSARNYGVISIKPGISQLLYTTPQPQSTVLLDFKHPYMVIGATFQLLLILFTVSPPRSTSNMRYAHLPRGHGCYSDCNYKEVKLPPIRRPEDVYRHFSSAVFSTGWYLPLKLLPSEVQQSFTDHYWHEGNERFNQKFTVKQLLNMKWLTSDKKLQCYPSLPLRNKFPAMKLKDAISLVKKWAK